ncbi:zinc ribbon domain-containing protein [Bacillus methanolicus]|uniref:zinc ribbon domain-containing protein n=1 Tax=Bacillus methanolicus TaxID=1471 RepID=UPI0023801E51|nr:zinc ribbon domain-containing protein [Bacillus methanolicus]MDE3840202.1 zinc ribbon domain-containing protein [Bacillus methanolicus]
MSDIQTKLGEGLNMLQGSLQQGKQKLQIAQEISQLKKSLQETIDQRANLIIKIGEQVYKMLRMSSLHDDTLTEMAQPLLDLDKQIYQIRQSLEELNKTTANGNACSNCRSPVSENDRFCGSCGSKIAAMNTADNEERIQCGTCSATVPATAQFCGCCGVKI